MFMVMGGTNAKGPFRLMLGLKSAIFAQFSIKFHVFSFLRFFFIVLAHINDSNEGLTHQNCKKGVKKLQK